MLHIQRHPRYLQKVYVPGTTASDCGGVWLSVLGRLRGTGSFDLTQNPRKFGLHLVQSGAGWLSVDGGSEQSLAPGDAFLIAPGELSRYREDPRRPWRYTWLGFDGEKCSELMRGIGFTSAVRILRAAATPALWQVCDEAESAYSADSCSPFVPTTLAFRIAEGFVRGHVTTHADPASAMQLIMNSGYIGEMTVGAAAERLGVDRSTLFRRFRVAYGSGPRAYLKAARLEHAGELLRREGATVATVAETCGYADYRAFSRAFKTRFGVNPSRWK